MVTGLISTTNWMVLLVVEDGSCVRIIHRKGE
jgi:hypothetical protein